jgi:hypothetical protein
LASRSGAYLDRWLVDGLTDHKATTRENYSTMVRKHIAPAIGSVRLDKLSPLDVQEEAGVLSGEVSNCFAQVTGLDGKVLGAQGGPVLTLVVVSVVVNRVRLCPVAARADDTRGAGEGEAASLPIAPHSLVSSHG